MANLRKHRKGCYRMSLPDGKFAQFIKGRYTSSAKWGDAFTPDAERGRHWAVEVRATHSGDLLRYAGVHESLEVAASEMSAEATA